MTLSLLENGRRGVRVDSIPVYDIHCHVKSMQGYYALPLEAQVAEMDRLGIDITMISSTTAIEALFTVGNDEVAACVRQFPGRFYGYCHISAVYPDLLVPELERCFAMDGVFKGIKLYQVGPNYDDPRYDYVWSFARERKLPVLAHTWGDFLTGFDRAAEKHPEVAFLAAHSGSSFAYKTYIDAAKKHPNFYLDLTYSREHFNMIERFVEVVGADQIVWGTDAPLFSMAHQLGKVLFARIPEEAKKKILGTNAARLFGFPLEKASGGREKRAGRG